MNERADVLHSMALNACRMTVSALELVDSILNDLSMNESPSADDIARWRFAAIEARQSFDTSIRLLTAEGD